ncbi:arylsulfatase [uncultured Paludibaculum sp.]|uniref:arylsulfatase n=1 Tax=uncultured Paludibaculum sp. TaxID=1765020 RepID=UPI002AAA754D|nr:arylsulfatase [uncultured Paludibaculum sp.]
MNLTRRSFLASAAATAAPAPRRPNILLILADDMGFSDTGCYGSEISTPNLDRLAGQGVRFTQFYNCARCCPSRASLLTGLYPHHAGIGHMVDRAGPAPGYVNDLSPRSRTIAEVLRASGYQTGMTGKWHVTPVNDSQRNWPMQRGFDRYYGIIHGAADYYNPVTLKRGNDPAEPGGPDFFLTDAIGDNGVQFLDEFKKKDDPFFLYAAFTAPHWPLHARAEDIRKYESRYRDGWDALREQRHQRQLGMGMLSRRWDLSARDAGVPAWSDAPNRSWEMRRMAVYAAMVEQLDRNIGRLLDRLRQNGQEDNTLVMFMADNGGCAEEIRAGWTGRHIPKGTRDGRHVQIGNNPSVMPGPDDTYQSYGLNWANASNTPFRLYKHWVHEGGISTPLIARWPSRFRPSTKFIDTPSHFIDVMATCVDASRASYPGGDVIPMQGHSLLPSFEGRATAERSLYWEHEGNCAVRRGPWKLVRKHPGDWELYNMETDRTELHNLAASKPHLVGEMSASWSKWATDVGVLPWQVVDKQMTNR